ncbi:hypothetical protein HMN09_01279100 [Mycena chlorophos]|uniref:Uncharacterized protein n=1 Tax=Mycena chlorophos TaxID=658473 RepID=A0A8H6S2G0_MYCCL|nr:hypothetical protein HMN09_01279100 [Mycena chlorophos]
MFSYCHELITGLVSSARGRRPGPNSDELEEQITIYTHQLYHLEDLAAAPDLNDEERAKLEEQCAQTRDQLEMIQRRYIASLEEERYQEERPWFTLNLSRKDKNA